MNKIHNAIIYAAKKHEGQVRKGTDTPYIVHPMEVMQILTAAGCGEDVIVAGILHDTVEDTDATLEEISALFGEKVARLVAHESEDKSKTWRERKSATILFGRRGDMYTRRQTFQCAQYTCGLRTCRRKTVGALQQRQVFPAVVLFADARRYEEIFRNFNLAGIQCLCGKYAQNNRRTIKKSPLP